MKNKYTAHNWQKWKKYALTRLCRKIHRVEIVDVESSNYTFEITISVSMWNLGQFRENLKFESKNLIAHMWHIY